MRLQFGIYRARLKRPIIRDVTFIGITGSCGKTTAAALVDAVVSQRGMTHAGTEWNRPPSVASTVNAIPTSARFCIQELSGEKPGMLAESLKILRPDIGVVLNVASDHYKEFRGLEATAQEKGTLVEKLPVSGTAVLNADDPYVRAMAQRTRAKVLTFGLSPNADVRAIEVSSSWPQRLCLKVRYKYEKATVSTQLIGEHWTPSVLAAIACGVACGLNLEASAKGVETVSPITGRNSVHERSDGAVYVLDTHKAPFWTLSASYALVANAHAPRKTLVIGTVSDYPGERSRRYRRIARRALDVADRVVFVGSSAGHVSKIREERMRDRLFVFETVYQASKFLAADCLPGELIYVKASGSEHLERIMLSAMDEVLCWREKCGMYWPCQRCQLYAKPSPPPFGIVAY